MSRQYQAELTLCWEIQNKIPLFCSWLLVIKFPLGTLREFWSTTVNAKINTRDRNRVFTLLCYELSSLIFYSGAETYYIRHAVCWLDFGSHSKHADPKITAFVPKKSEKFILYKMNSSDIYCVVFLLQKCLDTLDLTSLGVGSCVGTGMYLVAGMVARNVAGPGVIISFIIAAVASVFSGKNTLLHILQTIFHALNVVDKNTRVLIGLLWIMGNFLFILYLWPYKCKYFLKCLSVSWRAPQQKI